MSSIKMRFLKQFNLKGITTISRDKALKVYIPETDETYASNNKTTIAIAMYCISLLFNAFQNTKWIVFYYSLIIL